MQNDQPEENQAEPRTPESIESVSGENGSGENVSTVQDDGKKRISFVFLFWFFALSGLVFTVIVSIFVFLLMPTLTEEPEEVEEVKSGFTSIRIPAEFSERVAITTDNFLYKFSMVICGTEDAASRMVLVNFSLKEVDDPGQEQQVLNNLLSYLALLPEEQEHLNWEPNEISFEDKTIEYEFVKGIEVSTRERLYMMRGPLPYSGDEKSELIYLTTTEDDLVEGAKIVENLKQEK